MSRPERHRNISRRHTLATMAAASAWLSVARLLDAASMAGAAHAQDPRFAGGRLLRTLPLGRLDRRPKPPMHTLLGTGLDARQFTDLSNLSPETLLTPTERFYIRTAAPSGLPDVSTKRLILGGAARDVSTVLLSELQSQSQPLGVHLLECAGNNDPANFGLLSAAAWGGVRVTSLLDRLPRGSSPTRIRVTGFDDQRSSATSVPGAAWVFTREELETRGAFLATTMNGDPLTPDHGAPLRLVVPNYYGCSAIKWVTRIDAVPDDEPATTQMREFSARTHQDGLPRLAREYEPPAIDLAATPVRVEEWVAPDARGGERRLYRVIGIRWGGTTRRVPLAIRFHHRDPFVPVDECPDPESTTTWSLWSHVWAPPDPGRYQIALHVTDPAIRTRRLDLYYYTREVEIG